MTPLLIHAALGVLTVVVFFRVNRHLYTGGWRGSGVTPLEALYYVLAIGSVCTGWSFNVIYVRTYPAEQSWVHFTSMRFTNPAAASSRPVAMHAGCNNSTAPYTVDGGEPS